VRNRHEHKCQQKKIESIQSPAQKTGEESVALLASERLEKSNSLHGFVVAAAVLSSNECYISIVRYLVKAKLKSEKNRKLLDSIDKGTLGRGSVAGDEYVHNMNEARIDTSGIATWVETCFCDPPLAEERPYWEEYFHLLSVSDAHSRRNCRHENGTEPWACCDCDCTRKLEEKMASRGESFLEKLRAQNHPSS
jgi:hypothetical protein